MTDFYRLNEPPTPGDLVRIMAVGGPASGDITPIDPLGAQTDSSSGHPCASDTTFALPLADGTEWCDVSIKGGAKITATSGKILVGHFMKGRGPISPPIGTETGDPSFVLVTPTEPMRLRCSHRFFSFGGFDHDPVTMADGSYVNFVAPTTAIGLITLDGDPLGAGTTCIGYSPVTFPASTYSWTRCRLANPPAAGAQHRIDTAVSGTTHLIGAYAYGQREYGAYAYATGIGF